MSLFNGFIYILFESLGIFLVIYCCRWDIMLSSSDRQAISRQ